MHNQFLKSQVCKNDFFFTMIKIMKVKYYKFYNSKIVRFS